MTIASLWLPILVAAVGVWITSAIVWMVLPHHKSDFKALSDEKAVADVLRGTAPGQYNIPHYDDRAEMSTPEGIRAQEEGPMVLLTVWPNGVPAMGKSLGIWFVFCTIIGIFVAAIGRHALGPGAGFEAVFHITAAISFLAYGAASVQRSVWFGEPWGNTLKHLVDSLLYAAVTGLAFAFLWH